MFDLVSSNPMIQMMDRSMTLATRRMSLIAGNLANIDTPGFKARDLDFESAFKAEMARMDRQMSPSASPDLPSHFPDRPSGPPASTAGSSSAYERNDLNDVTLDRQTMLLAKTQNLYQLSSLFAQAELRKVLNAVREGAK